MQPHLTLFDMEFMRWKGQFGLPNYPTALSTAKPSDNLADFRKSIYTLPIGTRAITKLLPAKKDLSIAPVEIEDPGKA
jgi:hypothetical protein